jgi:stalled ribosome rescue protein Dom34
MHTNEFHHAIVWIDHQQARVFHFGPQGVQATLVHSTHRHEHLHHKANSIDSGKAPRDDAFLERVGAALASSAAILVTGPANAKRELMSYLEHKAPAVASCVVAVEPLDRPSDGQLEAFARKYFHADERMRHRVEMSL